MSKLYSSRHILHVLEREGFSVVSRKGSHVKLRKSNPARIVIVPADRKEIPRGTFRSILRQSQLLEQAFQKD